MSIEELYKCLYHKKHQIWKTHRTYIKIYILEEYIHSIIEKEVRENEYFFDPIIF